MTGKIIAFEGIDGCGKSTYVNEIHHWLNKAGQDTIKTSALSEGSTNTGRAIGNLLRSKAAYGIDPIAEALLIAAARRDNWEREIGPAVLQGWFVVTDRHLDSMFCYQDKVPPSVMDHISQVPGLNIEADLTFLVDLPPDHERIRLDPDDRLEARSDEWWGECRERFLKRFREKKSLSMVIDNTRPFEENLEIVKEEIRIRLLGIPIVAPKSA